MRVGEGDLLNLVRQWFPGRITGLSVQELGGDASDRNYYRLHLQGKGTHRCRTVVVMELATPFGGKDLPFVDILQALERAGLGVPRLFGVAPEQGILLLEDLGDELLQWKVEGLESGEIEAFYSEAVDMIVQMQWGLEPSSGCVAFQRAFTVERFVWELEFFRLHYIEGFLGRAVHWADRKAMDRLFLWLSTLLDGEKKVFTHRDYHARNLIFHDGRLKVLDFQDARLGPALYDVASLLRDSYVVLPEDLVECLLDDYLSASSRMTGERIDRSRFRYVFDMASLQRNLKAIGTFAYQAVEAKNPRYLRYIPPTLAYIEGNLQRYEELAPCREVLARYLPFAGGSSR